MPKSPVSNAWGARGAGAPYDKISAKRKTSSTSPPLRGNAVGYRGETHAGARARSAHAIGAERAARGRDRGSSRYQVVLAKDPSYFPKTRPLYA